MSHPIGYKHSEETKRKLALAMKRIGHLPPKYKAREAICIDCKKPFIKRFSFHLRCGSARNKTGCSYKHTTHYNPSRHRKPSAALTTEARERRRANDRERRLRLRFRIFQRDSFTCKYCGRTPPNVSLHIDHIFPKSKGGKNDPSNYITACADCNFGKGDIILDEFISK